MTLINSFSKKAPNRVFLSIILGALSGICYSGLIPLVLSGIRPPDPLFAEKSSQALSIFSIEISNYKIAMLYFIACVLILLMRSFSEILLIRVASEVRKDLRVNLYKQVFSAPLIALEKIGSSRLIASINIDVPQIIMGAGALPALLINIITLVGMLSFLMYLNMDVFQLVIVAILIGSVCYQLPMMIGARVFRKSREIHDDLQESIRGLIYGAKELKLDSAKREAYFQKLLAKNEKDILVNDKKAQTIMRATTSFGDLISFFVIGAVGFIFVNYYSITKEELIGVVMALLYVTGPIAVLLNAIPTLTVASISYMKFSKLLGELPDEKVSVFQENTPEWSIMALKDVQHEYPSNGDEDGFRVGPLSLEIIKGEICFIIGANGSGKSTLSKILTMHYRVSGGTVEYDNEIVDNTNIEKYRQSISAIYSDYYLFDRVLVNLTSEVVQQAEFYLKKFHLDGKVKIIDGKFSTLSLSDGQRKRLALLVSFLEDKQLYLFDEWAADQDPEFKEIFYKEILPSLKERNKAVVVISHDDRYFQVADKLIVLEQGQVIK